MLFSKRELLCDTIWRRLSLTAETKSYIFGTVFSQHMDIFVHVGISVTTEAEKIMFMEIILPSVPFGFQNTKLGTFIFIYLI